VSITELGLLMREEALRHVQLGLRSGHCHVKKPTLFLDLLRRAGDRGLRGCIHRPRSRLVQSATLSPWPNGLSRELCSPRLSSQRQLVHLSHRADRGCHERPRVRRSQSFLDRCRFSHVRSPRVLSFDCYAIGLWIIRKASL